MSAEFADTNVVLYLLDDGAKAMRAEEILGQGPRVSVQVLNEALVNCRRKAGLSWEDTGAFLEGMVNCRRKAGLSWEDTGAFLEGIKSLCSVEDLTVQTHQVGRALAEKYQLSVYDAMIVSAALIAGCTTLWTEDMHDGLLIEDQLRVVNPFA